MSNILGLILFITVIPKIVLTLAMVIPEDVEILNDFKVEESSKDHSSDSSFLEAESLRNFELTKAIRNRRSLSESSELLSDFHLIPSEFFLKKKNFKPKPTSIERNSLLLNRLKRSIFFEPLKRQKRSEKSVNINESDTEKDKIDSDTSVLTSASISSLQSLSNLPVPEKQVMEPLAEYYRKGGWNVQSFNTDYTRGGNQPLDDDEIIPEATINNGIKGRTPRVNFITQPKRSSIEEIKEHPILSKYSVQPLSRYGRMQSSYSSYPDYYPSRSYDPYLRRYDRFDDQYTRYDPYYEDYYLHRRRFDPYDSYSPRAPSYSESFYDYPDRRFDIPEPRSDYRPLYSNDLYYDRPPLSSSSSSTPAQSAYERSNRRIIYYAHLPEIIRTPSSIDLTYGSYGRDSRYDTNLSSSGVSSAGYHQHHQQHTSDNSNSNVNKDYGFIKREKKDHRNYPSYQKTNTGNGSNGSSVTNLKQDP